MSDLGSLRRSPRLWEQQVASRLQAIAAGQSVPSAPVQDGLLEGQDPVDPEPDLPTTLGKPSTPRLDKGVGTIIVIWDGLDDQGQPYPATVDVEVHVSLTSGFTPSAATKRGVMPAGGGQSIIDGLSTFTPPKPYWVRLLGVDQEGGSAASAQISGYPGEVVATDIGEGVITADKVSFNARQIGGVTTGIGNTLPPIGGETGALEGDIFLLKVRNPQGQVEALKQYQCDGTKWVPVEWGADALSAKCITAIQITAGAVTADAILGNEITADKIKTGTITSNSACIGSLDASKITAGFLSADRISGGVINGSSIRTPNSPNNSQIEIGNVNGEAEDYIKFLTGGSGSQVTEGQIRANTNGMTLIAGDSPIRLDRGSNPGGRSADVIFNSPSGGGNWRIFLENLPEATFSAPSFDVIGVRNSDGQLFRFPSVTVPEPAGESELLARIEQLEQRLAALEEGP